MLLLQCAVSSHNCSALFTIVASTAASSAAASSTAAQYRLLLCRHRVRCHTLSLPQPLLSPPSATAVSAADASATASSAAARLSRYCHHHHQSLPLQPSNARYRHRRCATLAAAAAV
jgi:hypothetical protein